MGELDVVIVLRRIQRQEQLVVLREPPLVEERFEGQVDVVNVDVEVHEHHQVEVLQDGGQVPGFRPQAFFSPARHALVFDQDVE